MKKLALGLIILSALGLSGCGVIVGMRADAALFNMQTVQENIEPSPVKSTVYKKVKSIVVADLSGTMGPEFSADNVPQSGYCFRTSEISRLNSHWRKGLRIKPDNPFALRSCIEFSLENPDERITRHLGSKSFMTANVSRPFFTGMTMSRITRSISSRLF